jgi:formamidopyrimidine-DNA glycosylase
MPELPDLEVFSRNLTKRIAGKKVKEVNVPVVKKLNVDVKSLKKAIEKQKLEKIYRVGKELHFEFANGNILGLHMMLKGDLHLFEKTNEHKHTVLEIIFEDGFGLALTDWQKQATPTLNPEVREAPDALSKEVNVKFLKEQLSKSRTTIKNLLLDQHIVRGIGNAYSDEILWDAGISPFSAANKIPPEKIKALAKSIKTVLQQAQKQILKSHPDIISGEVRDFLKIHNAKKKESPGGAPILHKMVNSRKTYYTEEQELYE